MFRNTPGAMTYTSGASGALAAVTIIAAFTAGAMLVVWLGERIDEKGIGNGISLILFAGIVSRVPSSVLRLGSEMFKTGGIMWLWVPLTGIVFLLEIAFIVLMNNAERRIPVQYAKRVVGRKMYGGQSSFMPIKVNMSGVLPVIFASTFLAIPGTIGGFLNLNPVEYPKLTI